MHVVHRTRSRNGERLLLFTLMSHRQSLETLVLAHVPLSRNDEALKNELVAHCEDVLNRCIGRRV